MPDSPARIDQEALEAAAEVLRQALDLPDAVIATTELAGRAVSAYLAAVGPQAGRDGLGDEAPSGRPVPAGQGSDECVFCAIAARDPDHQIEVVVGDSIVITPRDPVCEGHKLVVPMTHVRDAAEAPRVTAGAMRDAAAYIERAGVGDCNVITSVGSLATQTVFHLHVHIVPRRAGDGLLLPWSEPSSAAPPGTEPEAESSKPCPTCEGDGMLWRPEGNVECETCGGSGAASQGQLTEEEAER